QQDISSASSLHVFNTKTEKQGLENYLNTLESNLLLLKNRSSNAQQEDKNTILQEEELSLRMEKLLEQESAISIMLSDISVTEDYARSIDKRLAAVKESLRKYKDVQKM